MLISTDLTFDLHVTSVSGQCFYQLRQLRSVRQSLDTESTTLIRAFVSSRVDYCCSLLIGSSRSVTDKLQRVLNAADSVITNIKKYESVLSQILHHWLDVTEWIRFRVAAIVYQCLHSMAPAYLTELCTPITASESRHCGLDALYMIVISWPLDLHFADNILVLYFVFFRINYGIHFLVL